MQWRVARDSVFKLRLHGEHQLRRNKTNRIDRIRSEKERTTEVFENAYARRTFSAFSRDIVGAEL